MPLDDSTWPEPPPLQVYRVPYAITGELVIRATDIDAAMAMACMLTPEDLARRGALEIFEPERR